MSAPKFPREGGSYVRGADGSLTRVEGPTTLDPFYAAFERGVHPDRRVREAGLDELARLVLGLRPLGAIERRMLATLLVSGKKPKAKPGPKINPFIAMRNAYIRRAFHARPPAERDPIFLAALAKEFSVDVPTVQKAAYGPKVVRKNSALD